MLGMGNDCLMDVEFPFGGNENVLELDRSGGCVIL